MVGSNIEKISEAKLGREGTSQDIETGWDQNQI